LRQMELPYQVVGGLKFYERKEVKDILAYMRVVLNPADSVSLKRIVNVPVRGIGKSSLEKVEAYCDQQNLSLLEGLRQAESQKIVSTRPAKKIAQFVALIDQLHSIYEERAAEVFLNEILARTGYMAKLENENSVESQSRLENLNELYSAVEQFSESHPENSLRDFLDTTALVSDLDNFDDSRGVLPLMTLHTCKGLEFEGVCMIGVENGLLPHASSMSSAEEFEEERRLCYVGITRAKSRLMITNARRRRIFGNTYNYQPSDFLTAIPGEVLQKEMAVGGFETRSPSSYKRQPEMSLLEPVSRVTSGNGEYCVGTKVLHPKFGSGVVVNREGSEGDWKVVVSRGDTMYSINRRFMWRLVLVVALVFTSSPVWAGDAVSFSGNVKKVIAAKNKVAIKDPATKKRFTVVVNEKSKLKGISGIGDLKKGDAVTGQYVVTDKGLYVVTEMTKK